MTYECITEKYTQVFMYKIVIKIVALGYWLGLRLCPGNRIIVGSTDTKIKYLYEP